MIGPFLLSFLSAAVPLGGRHVEVGDVPRHTFQRPPLNGVLVRSLEDLRGRPVLFEFWGTRCPGCVETAVPAALKLQETWSEDLVVVFVESQGAGAAAAHRFALEQRWLGGRALWTDEVPFWPGGHTLPVFVLLDASGEVVLKGNPIALERSIERLVAEEVRQRRGPPRGTPEALAPAWAEFARNRFARALQLAEDVVSRAEKDAARASALRESAEALRARIDRRFARAAALAEAGLFEEAGDLLDALRSGSRGDADLEQRARDLALAIEGDGLAAERSAATELTRLVARFHAAGGDAASTRELERFAERRSGTRAAARALEWVRIAAPRGR